MARTVYTGSRTFDCSIDASKIARDPRFPYAVMVTNTSDEYSSDTVYNHTKMIGLYESDFPIFAESYKSSNRTMYLVNMYGKYDSSSKIITANGRFSARVTGSHGDGAGKEGSGTCFFQVGVLKSWPVQYAGDNYAYVNQNTQDRLSRLDGADQVVLSFAALQSKDMANRYFYGIGSYAIYLPSNPQVILTVTPETYEQSSGNQRRSYHTEYTDVDNVPFSTFSEWRTWCKEHDNG